MCGVSNTARLGAMNMLVIYLLGAAVVSAVLTAVIVKVILDKKFANQTELQIRNRTALVKAASHELRTPLNDILGLIDAVKPEISKLSDRGQKAMEQLSASGGELYGMLLDVLEIFDLSNQTIEMEESVFNVEQLILSNLTCLENTYPDINFEYSVDEDIWVNADRVRSNQCLRTLLEQAAFQTKSGTISVDVHMVGRIDKVGLIFDITDTSAGMDQYAAQRYFVPDEYELNPALRGRPAAMLSMNLAKGIAEKMGGMMQASSKVANGVTFKWELVTELGEAPEVEAEAAVTDMPQGHPSQVEPMVAHVPEVLTEEDVNLSDVSVLIIDDNETNLMVLEAFLEAYEPKQVLKANSGREALEVAKTVQCDLIFTDIQMPELDGFETTRLIKGLGVSYTNVPVVAISAGSKFDNIPKCRDAGMVGYVEKPLSKEALSETLIGISPKVRQAVQAHAA